VVDGTKEDDQAPVEAAVELLAPTNGGDARVSSRTSRSSKARRTKRKSGEDCRSARPGTHGPTQRMQLHKYMAKSSPGLAYSKRRLKSLVPE